jgi:hypothetical protein
VRQRHRTIVLYDCHSIRSVIPRLFDGELPQFNIGELPSAHCYGARVLVLEQGPDHDERRGRGSRRDADAGRGIY